MDEKKTLNEELNISVTFSQKDILQRMFLGL